MVRYLRIGYIGRNDWFHLCKRPQEAYVRFVRYEDAYPINFTAFSTGSGVVAKKLLDGVKSSNPEINGYTKNSLIETKVQYQIKALYLKDGEAI